MDRRHSFCQVILPTSELLTEYDVHDALLGQAQIDLKTVASYVLSIWCDYEADHWQYYNPYNLSTVEMLMMLAGQDLITGLPELEETDRRHVAIILASFIKRFYFDIISTIEAFCLNDEQLRQLEVVSWHHLDLEIRVRMR